MTISAKVEYDGGDSKGGTIYTATLTSPTTVTVAKDGRVIERDATWGAEGITGGSGLAEMSDDALDALCLALARAESGAALAARRVAAGLTQAALAARLGVAQPRVAEWESGRVAPSAAALRGIDAALAEGGAEPVACECGEWSGEPCAWSGPRSETVRVRYVPEQWRGTAEAAGTWRGVAATMRVSLECAALMAETDPDWTEQV